MITLTKQFPNEVLFVDQYQPIQSLGELKGRFLFIFALLATLIVYLCLGAACFSVIESGNEKDRWQQGRLLVKQWVDENAKTDNHTERERQINSLTRLVRTLADEGNPYIYERREDAFSFTGGMYVAVSVVTTIGYGNIYPVTAAGQAFLVVYALIGIPLSFLFIAYLGAILASTVEYFLKEPLVKRNCGYNSVMALVLVISAILVIAELAFFSLWIKYGLDRQMTMWDSFYFAFISFTTIGFGNHGFYNGDNANLAKVIFTLLLVILCLAPLSLYINLLTRDFMSVASPFLKKMGVGATSGAAAPSSDDEREMIANTKEFKGESYGAASADTS